MKKIFWAIAVLMLAPFTVPFAISFWALKKIIDDTTLLDD